MLAGFRCSLDGPKWYRLLIQTRQPRKTCRFDTLGAGGTGGSRIIESSSDSINLVPGRPRSGSGSSALTLTPLVSFMHIYPFFSPHDAFIFKPVSLHSYGF